MRILIPARRGSKGFQFKNRKLLNHTLSIIPPSWRSITTISTDDELIKAAIGPGLKIKLLDRPPYLAGDKVSMRRVLEHFIDEEQISGEVIITLYLTYPERQWRDVIDAYVKFNDLGASSLLCRKKIVGNHPYCMLMSSGKYMGEQLTAHDLYRRQDYPECFEISHYISIIRSQEIHRLNQNLYNKETYFHWIDEHIMDVDTEEQFDKFCKTKGD